MNRNLIPPLLCFAVLSGLTAHRENPTFKSVAIATLGGALVAWLCLWLLGRLLYVSNSKIRASHGWTAVNETVSRNFLFLIPYTVLALIADQILGWNATLAFASAGIMTSGSAVGADLMKLGGGKIANMLLPMAGGMGFTMLWMTSGMLLRILAR
jgi:hypothetical protein